MPFVMMRRHKAAFWAIWLTMAVAEKPLFFGEIVDMYKNRLKIK